MSSLGLTCGRAPGPSPEGAAEGIDTIRLSPGGHRTFSLEAAAGRHGSDHALRAWIKQYDG